MAVAAQRILTAISRSLCLCAPFLAGIDCATTIGWFLCVALALCAVALLGQAFVVWWPSIQETYVFIILGKPQWRWQHIEYSPQALALCVYTPPCWLALIAQLLDGFFVLLLHFAQWLCWVRSMRV